MKKITSPLYSLFFVAICVLAWSCHKNSLLLEATKKVNTTYLSVETIKNAINYKQSSDKSVFEIKNVTDYKKGDTLTSIIEYRTKANNERKVAIKSSIEKDGMVIPRWRIECQGDCSQSSQCQLVGPISEYLECSSCSGGCAMLVTVLKLQQEAVENLDVTRLAEDSYEKTFKEKGLGVKVHSVEFIEDPIAKVYIVSYQDLTGKASTFSILEYKQPYNGREPKKKIKVDCVGSCDCRERYILGSGAVECTCNECEMYVTEL